MLARTTLHTTARVWDTMYSALQIQRIPLCRTAGYHHSSLLSATLLLACLHLSAQDADSGPPPWWLRLVYGVEGSTMYRYSGQVLAMTSEHCMVAWAPGNGVGSWEAQLPHG